MISGLFDGPSEHLGRLDPPLRLGTSSWSAADWKGPFYPRNARPGEFLAYYAQHFDAVECDATFYATPALRTVEGWRAKTPENFMLASKLPREITHDLGMVDCAEVLRGHLHVMSTLGSRLGPIVAQFAYVARGRDAQEHATGDDFRARLTAFLELWPGEIELVVEVRNSKWIAPPLLDLLRGHDVGLVLPAYYTMPGPATAVTRCAHGSPRCESGRPRANESSRSSTITTQATPPAPCFTLGVCGREGELELVQLGVDRGARTAPKSPQRRPLPGKRVLGFQHVTHLGFDRLRIVAGFKAFQRLAHPFAQRCTGALVEPTHQTRHRLRVVLGQPLGLTRQPGHRLFHSPGIDAGG